MPMIVSKGAASAQGFGFGAKAAGGPGTFGIFALGVAGCCGVTSYTKTRNKYTFATDTAVLATSSTSFGFGQSAAGNCAKGIFALGCNICGPTNKREKYIYACATSPSAQNSSTVGYSGAAAGNATIGIFALGTDASYTPTTTRNKYTYSSDTSCSAMASSIKSSGAVAAGNSTRGIFAIGYSSCAPAGIKIGRAHV